MLKIWNRFLHLGISDQLDEIEKNQVKMVNFGTLFVSLSAIAFLIQSFEVGNLALTLSLLASPIYLSTVFISHKYYKIKLARNILFFGLCAEVSIYALLDNPSSFTINYFFGLAMLSFIVYNKKLNRILGLALCVILYFGISIIQPHFQSILPFDPVIFVLDALTLFVGILLCISYFHKINSDYHDIIIKQKIELEKINVNKTKLLSMLTHDIRNPINSLNHLLDLQKDKILTHDELNFLFDKLRLEFVSQFESIENLLAWSQNQLTELSIKKEKTAVDLVLSNILKELNYNITQKEINVGMTICGNDIIDVDKTHLIIVLRNILNNAIKFTKNKGHIYITTIRDFNKYIIEVEDDGISFEGYSSTFSEFTNFTTHQGTNNEKGNGLGLMISKELVEKNNGKIFIKNNDSSGVVLRLEFYLNNI